MDETSEELLAKYGDTPRNRHLFGRGPKRVLAIDGGGVRGVISLMFLAKIQATLRNRTGNSKLLLCDYFDLIGGTSTGAIIAAGLALGLSVEHLIEIYRSLATQGFQKKSILLLSRIVAPKFKEAPLAEAIRNHVKDETLGSGKLLTGLGIVAKRLDSESVWLFHNNPRGPFYNGNAHFLLRDLIRASTAAPTYFTPQSIEVTRDDTGKPLLGSFIDGGVSPHNNPGLLMFMLTTVHGYGFRWRRGADDLLLVSVGNGAAGDVPTADRATRIPAALLGIKSLSSVMRDCSELNQALLQWMSRCPNRWHIDEEIGDLSKNQLAPEPLLHYLRYDVMLEAQWLKAHLGLDYDAQGLAEIRLFDRPDLTDEWLKIGKRAADQVKDDHFPAVFNALPVA